MIILYTIPYNSLPNDKIKEKVVVTFRSWLNNVYQIILENQVIHEIFEQLNLTIEFYKSDDGRKLFRIDDSDARLAEYLGERFAMAAKFDSEIMNKILVNMIKRNEDDERLKVR